MSPSENDQNVGQPWRKVRGLRASAEVVDQIREAFFTGMRSGDWLGTEAELADRFGVSRVTIRDAIRSLEAFGIVDVKVGAHGGIRVAEADPDRFTDALAVQMYLMGVTWEELLDAQEAIEPATAVLAARNATAEDIARLEQILNDAGKLLDDPEEFTDNSLNFHIAIAEAAGNRALHASMLALRRVERGYYHPRTTRRRAQRVLAMHKRIYDAIAGHDEQAVQEAMSEHLQTIRTRRADGDL